MWLCEHRPTEQNHAVAFPIFNGIEKAGHQTHTNMIHPLMFTKVALSSTKKWRCFEKFLSLFTKEQGAIINILIVHVREINTAGKKAQKVLSVCSCNSVADDLLISKYILLYSIFPLSKKAQILPFHD